MPTNLYGPGDNYHPTQSHVIPALLRRFHDAKVTGSHDVEIWGTGSVRREFMFVEDMAKACIAILTLPESEWGKLLARDRNDGLAPLVNVGTGTDITISELATLIAQVVGFSGTIKYDHTKPDGTPRKLMSIQRLRSFFKHEFVELRQGLSIAYKDFLENGSSLRM
jgi:GDP-L-fucose synthase